MLLLGEILIVLLVVGLIVYLLGLAPIDARIKQIGQAIIIVGVLIWIVMLVTGYHLPHR